MLQFDNPQAGDVFATELAYIRSEPIRSAVTLVLETRTPPWFFTVPTSPTGRHHPKDEHGEGGLVLHTRRVFWLAMDICRNLQAEIDQRDQVGAAALVHDIYTRGVDEEPAPHTVSDHEILVEYVNADLLDEYVDFGNAERYAFLTIAKAHGGRWGPCLPETDEQHILHLADYIASRSYVYINPDEAPNELR